MNVPLYIMYVHTYIHIRTVRILIRTFYNIILAELNTQTDIRTQQSDRQTDRQTDRQAGRQTDRQTGRQADRQADRQTDKQAGRKTDSGFNTHQEQVDH